MLNKHTGVPYKMGGCRRCDKRLTLFVLRTKAVALVMFARRSARPPALPPRGRLPPQSVSPPRGRLTSHSPRGRLTSHSPRGSDTSPSVLKQPAEIYPSILTRPCAGLCPDHKAQSPCTENMCEPDQGAHRHRRQPDFDTHGGRPNQR